MSTMVTQKLDPATRPKSVWKDTPRTIMLAIVQPMQLSLEAASDARPIAQNTICCTAKLGGRKPKEMYGIVPNQVAETMRGTSF